MLEDVLAALGVTVMEVPDMLHRACWVASERVALVRAWLDEDDREDALGAIIQLVCAADAGGA